MLLSPPPVYECDIRELTHLAGSVLAQIDEIEANTQYKKAEADMNLVKMMINLEDMDLANFKASFEMAESIKQNNNPRQQMSQPIGELYG